MLERCVHIMSKILLISSCTGGSRAKSEMGVLKEGVEEFDCVLVIGRVTQQWVITYLDIPGFGGTNRYSSPHS